MGSHTLQSIIRSTFSRQKEQVALRFKGQSFTYNELGLNSYAIASSLRPYIRKEDRVGLFIHKSHYLVESILGTLIAGGTYIPLDIKNPADRIKYILQNAGVKYIISISKYAGKLSEILKNSATEVKVLLLDEDGEKDNGFPEYDQFRIEYKTSGTSGRLSNGEFIQADQNSLAAILYTSGSTGVPKGVMIPHSSIHTFIGWATETFNISSDDILISHAPFHFDLSLFDIFGSIANGACMVLVPEEFQANPRYLFKLIEEEQVTIWQSVPSVLILMSEQDEANQFHPDRVKHVLFAGERMPVKYLKKLIRYFRRAEFYNIYGSTETNNTFMFKVNKDNLVDPLPIGKEILYVDYLIVDKNNKPVKEGEEGELLIHCPTNLAGYVGQDKEHDERFVKVHNGTIEREYFKTRDMVKLLPDHNMHLLGRADDVIKSSGYRVNLLEVEKYLLAHPHIVECAVVPKPDDYIGNKIIAIVCIKENTRLSVVELKVYSSKIMPKYMIPHVFHITEKELKKSTNGKIDKKYYKNFNPLKINAI